MSTINLTTTLNLDPKGLARQAKVLGIMLDDTLLRPGDRAELEGLWNLIIELLDQIDIARSDST